MFIIRGLPADETKQKSLMNSLREKAETAAGRSVVLVPRAFSTDRRDLALDICRASVVVMPSRAEGFGLVAMEAISYGVPVIVARDSGVAEVLQRYCVSPGSEARYIVDTRGGEDGVVLELAKALAFFVQVPARVKLLGEHLRKSLVDVCSWTAAARSFLADQIGPLPTPTLSVVADVRDEVAALLQREADYVDDQCQRTSGRSVDNVFVTRDFEELARSQPDGVSELLEPAPRAAAEGGRVESWEHVIRSSSTVVILGDPGAGKTLCLLREVRERCLSAVGALRAGSAGADDVTFAMYFHAGELAARLGVGESVLEVAVSVFVERHAPVSGVARHWLLEAVRLGRGLLVVDAVDEVRSAS